MMEDKDTSPFKIFLRRLTNLSGKNRMIYLSKLKKGNHFDLQKLSFLNGLPSFQLLEKIIHEKSITLCSLSDPRMYQANDASVELKMLKRTADFLFDEGGTKDLHLGWPLVRGKFNDGTRVNCPLLLFPVDLISSDKSWKLIPREGAGISFNKSFLLALSFYNHTSRPETLLEEDFEDVERDSTLFRTALYTMFQKEKLEIHFNTEMYRDELDVFPYINAEEFEQQHKPGQLKLFPNAVLGIFPQADSYLMPDYWQLLNKQPQPGLEYFFHSRSIVLGDANENFIQSVGESKVFYPFEIDSFQENILKAVKVGHSIVVQGPPGTGKSQLICNLLADALASKKNVLVVCQKRAALDVVWNRMNKAGFGNFLALVHDIKNDRKEIYSRINSQVESLGDFKSKINSIDAIQLERNFLQASNRIMLITEELEKFKIALFDTQECGKSAKELYLQTNPSAEIIIHVKQEFSQFRMDSLSNLLSKVKSLGNYSAILQQLAKPWLIRVPFVHRSTLDLTKIKSTVADVSELMKTLSQRILDITSLSLDYQQAEIFSNRINDLKLLNNILSNESIFNHLATMSREREGQTNTLWLQNMQRVIDDYFIGDGPEVSVESAQLGKFQQALHRSLKANKNLISWIRWQLFSEDKYLVKRALVSNNLSGRIGLKALERKLDTRLNLEHSITKLRETNWINSIPTEYTKEGFSNWFEQLILASRCNNLCDEIRNFKNFLAPHRKSHGEFIQTLSSLILLVTDFSQHHTKWSEFLHPRQIQELGMNFSKVDVYNQSLQNSFDTLCEHDDLLESLNSTEKEIYEKLLDATEFKFSRQAMATILENSIGLAWIDHLESKSPELRMVSSGKMEILEKELQENIQLKTQLSAEIVLLRAREKAIENLEYNRLNNLTTYRDLQHEVSKKKKIWPLRKLIASHHEDIFKVMPVWLASPESASALFPLQPIFDYVIFDEASQCFAERGIPAMARAKQVIVAGDKMQLKPGDFFQSRWEEDNETADTEAESLLDLTSRHWLTLNLQGHYRSQSAELVAFSNKNFYKDKLQLIPNRSSVNSMEPPITFMKVDGIWEDNANVEEALKVVEWIINLTHQSPEKTIGVITFNQSQQNLILDTIEAEFVRLGKLIPHSLFVKNIENVQGDERDIIIFSVGYAPDKEGKLRLQFGSLNAVGGENRLNVAITRAREKIIVVSSIMPNQLHTDETKNDGPKLLKEYLQYAYTVSQSTLMDRRETGISKVDQLKFKLKFNEAQTFYNSFPNADVVLKGKNGFEKIILTDDEFYEQALSVKHYHAFLPNLLESKGWKHQSVYSRNYWKDADRILPG